MRIKLMEPIELDGMEYPAGRVMNVSSALGVAMLQDQVAVPVPPEHARSVIQPEEQRQRDKEKKPNRNGKHA